MTDFRIHMAVVVGIFGPQLAAAPITPALPMLARVGGNTIALIEHIAARAPVGVCLATRREIDVTPAEHTAASNA